MSNNGCGQLGAIQTRGTCWFYSILNGFILSDDGQKILYNRLKNFYKKLKPVEKAYFDDQLNAPCPMKNLSKTKEIYFWKFIDQYLCFMSGPRVASLKAGKSASILGGMSLAGTVAKNLGGKGAYPQAEIEKILDHVGFAKDYYFKYADDPPKFHAARKPQFVIVRQSKYYPKSYMDEIPAGLLADTKYEGMCASLVIANTNANNSETHKWHAIAGYVCNGKGYIYDSNQRNIFKCNWWNLADFKKVANEEVAKAYPFFKGGQINVHMYAFAIFSRKEFTKDIGAACLMKYKTKTPTSQLNFTSPNLGARLNNSKLFTFLKPAERAALKRKWARTEHRAAVYINKATFNSIFAGANNRNSGYQQVFNLQNAGYKVKPENFEKFNKNLRTKFPSKDTPPKTLTFANAKTRLNQYTKSTAVVRKHQYSLVWKGLPMAQRKVLMHWRNKGEWLANNAFENKPKPPIKRKSVVKPKSPSPSPHAKRAIQVKSNFEKYWKAMQPENRQMIRNYVKTYKSPSPPKPVPKKLSPAKNSNALANAKRNVNALKTAKARKDYKRKRAVNMNQPNWTALGRYITVKNYEAQQARAVKKSVKK
jgi:hypothetical protein